MRSGVAGRVGGRNEIFSRLQEKRRVALEEEALCVVGVAPICLGTFPRQRGKGLRPKGGIH